MIRKSKLTAMALILILILPASFSFAQEMTEQDIKSARDRDGQIIFSKENPIDFPTQGFKIWMDFCEDNPNQVCIYFKQNNSKITTFKIFDKKYFPEKCEKIKLETKNIFNSYINFAIFCDEEEIAFHSINLLLNYNSIPKEERIIEKNKTIFSNFFNKKIISYRQNIDYEFEYLRFGGNLVYRDVDYYSPKNLAVYKNSDLGGKKILGIKTEDLVIKINPLLKKGGVVDLTKKLSLTSENLTPKQKLFNALIKINEEDRMLEQQEKNKGFLQKLFNF